LRAPSRLAEQSSPTHNVRVSAEEKTAPPDVLQRVLWIQTLTLIWMSVEAVVSLAAAWRAHSPALLAFGGDSAVELFSAAVVFWRFYPPSHRARAEEQASRIAGALLFVLAAFVVASSVVTLVGHVEARPSPIGIALLVSAAMIHAVACSTKAQALNCDGQCRVESRCCRVRSLRLSGFDCSGGSGRQCDFESDLGRPRCSPGIVAADCAGGMGSMEGQSLLPLIVQSLTP
jgi:hypothetical protein